MIGTLNECSPQFVQLQLNYCNYCHFFFYAGIAILVESFGFSSGVLGYLRRGLIDSKTAFSFALASMPAALLASKYLSLPELSLKTLYSLLMIGLSAYLLQQSTIIEENGEDSLKVTSTSFSNGQDDSLLIESPGE